MLHMLKTRATLWLIILSLGPATYVFAERTVGEHVDDSTLATAVKFELARTSDVPAGSINVEVHKGTVQLSGFIHKKAQKAAALAAVNGVEGVIALKDALIITDVPRSLGHFIDDQAIQAKLKVKMGDLVGVGTAFAVVTHVRNSEVIVAGFVASDAERKSVVEAAHNIKGVTKVYNKVLLGSAG